MFMKDDKNKKNSATLIIARMRKKPEGEELKEAPKQDGAYMDDTDDKMIAVDEIMQAIEKKDKRMLKEALSSMISMCMEEYDEPSEEKEEGEEA